MTPTSEKREGWIDVAKGIGILTVVFGHSGDSTLVPYLYWFHMPLFFIISGYLHKQPQTLDGVLNYNLKRTVQLLVPYVSFYLLILFIQKVGLHQSMTITMNDLEQLLLGGQRLDGSFGPFWFITTLYLTQVVFSFLLRAKNNKLIFLVIIAFYMLSFLDSSTALFSKDVIWNANVTLIAIVYYYVGYLLKNRHSIFNRYTLIICLTIIVVFISFNVSGFYGYSLNMKTVVYNNFLLDLIIPISFSLIVLMLSRCIEKSQFGNGLSFVGKFTLTIMYLHIPVNLVASQFLTIHPVVFLGLGTTIPIFISIFIFEKFDLTRFLFLGILPDRKKTSGNK